MSAVVVVAAAVVELLTAECRPGTSALLQACLCLSQMVAAKENIPCNRHG